ncbi:uncharacterized protein LOC116601178 [Nematostella vectensis]|uniref:uncharacterized protein LOC116601178 n=1 Tax=Nematostella vectensis TaxID=45351 RepID=UPI00207743CC|nr:uncharacterized protein LOC116601178 [Nematostella vectensis]
MRAFLLFALCITVVSAADYGPDFVKVPETMVMYGYNPTLRGFYRGRVFGKTSEGLWFREKSSFADEWLIINDRDLPHRLIPDLRPRPDWVFVNSIVIAKWKMHMWQPSVVWETRQTLMSDGKNKHSWKIGRVYQEMYKKLTYEQQFDWKPFWLTDEPKDIDKIRLSGVQPEYWCGILQSPCTDKQNCTVEIGVPNYLKCIDIPTMPPQPPTTIPLPTTTPIRTTIPPTDPATDPATGAPPTDSIIEATDESGTTVVPEEATEEDPDEQDQDFSRVPSETKPLRSTSFIIAGAAAVGGGFLLICVLVAITYLRKRKLKGKDIEADSKENSAESSTKSKKKHRTEKKDREGRSKDKSQRRSKEDSEKKRRKRRDGSPSRKKTKHDQE